MIQVLQASEAEVPASLLHTGLLSDSVCLKVARLKGAGALLLGKGNMGEWAFSPTFSLSSIAGAVRNPYDLDRTPAGSSGGPAAGVLPQIFIIWILPRGHCLKMRIYLPTRNDGIFMQPLWVTRIMLAEAQCT